MDNPNSNHQSMRVLIRPPMPIPPPSPPPTPPDPSAPPPQTSQNGVVVVGFIGKRHGDVIHLINRIIDANVFGSGNSDTPFIIEKHEIVNEEMEEWFKCRSISFYFEEEKGILYLQFSSTSCPVMEGFLESRMGFDSVLEDREFGDLQGMLFMFSVCHVIIYIQEGSHFDTQILKRFRVLQAAKHAITSYVKSRTTPPLTTNAHASSTSRMPISGASSNNPSPGRGRGILNRNASSVTLMHGLGSYSSLLPGQCTPVILFVFLDDFTDANHSSSSQEQVETSSNQSSSSSNMPRPSVPAKGSGSVVVLARPVNKLEGGLRKKLQSSLESQIRSLIKRGRILSSSETGQSGSRSGGTSSSAPLFLLDSSRAVGLVDLASNQAGESLEFATGLVEDVLDGKATSDSLLLESNSQNANKDDIISVKEFIFRQSDILRGRGGMVSSTNGGSAAGVGMVAVAAAAAAASAASVKNYSSPELPSLETWLSSSQPILHGILSAKRGGIDVAEINKRKPHQRNGVFSSVEGNTSKAIDHLQLAVSILESGRRLNSKFSTSWCEKALPIAKEIYLNELPPSYPTSQHQAHLERALFAFNSMVKGPAVQLYTKKLEDECLSIWSSGRQLCDAVSLTGKPCMHKRHNLETNGLLSSDEMKSHSSGYVFLHACACGRTRRLRDDPFDFETANSTFNSFSECDKLLPALELPQGSVKGFTKYLSWNLIRIGGARYYSPAKGLLQSGFCPSQKFLLKWTIAIGKQRSTNLPFSDGQQVPGNQLSSSSKDESIAGINMKKSVDAPIHRGEVQNVVEIQKRHSSNNIKSDDKTFSSGRGIPNSTTRKPFSEVVTGSGGANSGFPPLQMRKQPLPGTDKVSKHHIIKDQGLEKVKETANNQESQKVQDIFATDGTFNGNATNVDSCSDGDPFLRIGSNVVPVNMNTGPVLKGFTSLNEVTLYVGFEHECPHGHRFILRPDHLNDLGSPYMVPEESVVLLSSDNEDQKARDHCKFAKNHGHTKARRQSNGVIDMALRKARNPDESKARDAITKLYADGPFQISFSSKEQKNDAKLVPMRDLEASLEYLCLDDGGYAFNLLNRSLPIYMNCPHCQDSKRKKDTTIKFAGTMSQLQRIFLVTPSFPVTLAACPVVQFEESCLPPAIPDRKEKLQFSLGCRVILPPDSVLSLRLPFVYGVELEDGNLHPLTPFEHQPELTAWITKGTTLQVVSEGSNFAEREG